MRNIMDLVWTFAVGVAGWFVTHYLAAPILTFSQLRRAIHEELFFTKNIGWVNANGTLSPTEEKRHDQAVTELRRLAARMSALNATWPHLLSLYLSYRRYDFYKTIKGLTGLSNALADPADHAQFVTQVEEALLLPRSYSDETLGHLREHQSRRLERF
jgi:hypothetical protein